MKRAIAKGTVQFAFGRIPLVGTKTYRYLTRRLMGTQASHVDKLARVWPGYVKVWEEKCGLNLEGKRIWIHEGGYTLFPFFASYLVTGNGPCVTNLEGELAEQYVEKALEAACQIEIGERSEIRERQEQLQNWSREKTRSPLEWVELLEAEYIKGKSSIEGKCDLVHTGGALEHYKLPRLKSLLDTFSNSLNPGGISSHIFDHRDHLYHADKQFPFLNHLKYSEVTYRFLFGHELCYHNRLSSQEIRDLFHDSGLEEIALRRHILPDAKYVDSDEEAIATGKSGLNKEKLHSRFQEKVSTADLHTAAGHYLFRKPRS